MKPLDKKMHTQYDKYFIKPPTTLSELEHYIPFITPLIDLKYRKINTQLYILVLVTMAIQMVFLGLSTYYFSMIADVKACPCMEFELYWYLWIYPILKCCFLAIIFGMYTVFYNNPVSNKLMSFLYHTVYGIALIDSTVLYPVWLFLTSEYFKKLEFDRCNCADHPTKTIIYHFTTISISSYTIIILSLIHALVVLILANGLNYLVNQ
jgi:hypothetical protein